MLILSACSGGATRHQHDTAAMRESTGAALPPILGRVPGLFTSAEAEQYVGDQACVKCHAPIAAACSRSHHVDSLRPVKLAREGALFRKGQIIVDRGRGIQYSTAVQGSGAYVIAANDRNRVALPAHLVIGSAPNGYTFLSHLDSGQWVVLRTSYYVRPARWDFTPGQEPSHAVSSPGGDLISPSSLVTCLSCHVTTLRGSTDEIDLSGSHMGIGCEACHGAGRAHIDAVNSGSKARSEASMKLVDLQSAPAARVEAICSSCHGEMPQTAQGKSHVEKDLPRLQATALERSACYVKSRALSCVTCHDPHTNVQSVPATYDIICLSCHSPARSAAAGGKPPLHAGTTTAIICKVNPRTGCISCHMPRQKIPILSVMDTNHWIKVWPASASSQPTRVERTAPDNRRRVGA